MKKAVLASILTLCGTAGYLGLTRVNGTVEAGSVSNQTRAVVEATTGFLDTLTPEQRGKVNLAFAPPGAGVKAPFHRTPDGGVAPGAPSGSSARPQGPPGSGSPQSGPPSGERGRSSDGPGRGPGGPGGPGGGPGTGPPGGFIGERYGEAIWSNYPVSDVPRPGLQLGTLSQVQRGAAMHLLQVVLSPMGYQKVLDIMGSDQALTDAGTNFASGEKVYTIGIFGQPSVGKPWMLEFGGHHLGLNVVIAGSEGVMSPTLTGAQPSVYKRGEKTIRVLAKENDTAFALLDTLSPEQRKKAILNYEVRDLVLGPGSAGVHLQPEGVKGSELNEKQRAMLLDVVSQWVEIINNAYSKPRLNEIEAGINDTYFAWSGPLTHNPEKNGSSYYRIQGPKLVIEFSPQGVGGDPTMHVHTIYRDPTNDYGVKLTAAK